MADTISTGGSLSDAVTFKLHEKTIPIVRAGLVYAQFGQDGKLLPGTNTVRFVKKPDLAADTAYLGDEVTNPAAEALPAITHVDITTNEIGRVVSISRRAGNISPLELVDWAKDTLGYDAARRIDYEVLTMLSSTATVALHVTATTNMQIDGSTTRSSVNANFTMPFARKILVKLQTLDLDTSGDILAVTHPLVTGDLMGDTTSATGWVASHVYKPENMYNAEVGKTFNIRYATTTRGIKYAAAGSGAADVYATLVGLGPWAFGKVNIEALRFTSVSPTPDHADALGRTWKLGYYMDYGCGLLDAGKFIHAETLATAI